MTNRHGAGTNPAPPVGAAGQDHGRIKPLKPPLVKGIHPLAPSHEPCRTTLGVAGNHGDVTG
jgi:hypothetical protein